MATGKFILDMLVYSDETASNDPQERVFDYKKTVLEDDISLPTVQYLTIASGGAGTNLAMPDDAINWLYIETDQTINVMFNDEDYNSVEVSPSVAGTSDGVLFKRGEATGVLVYVPGAVDANLKVFMGV